MFIRFAWISGIMLFLLSFCSRYKLETYTHTDPAFRIDFPSGWEIRNKVAGTDVIAISPPESGSDDFRENINVVSEAISEEDSSEKYFSHSINSMRSFLTDFHLISGKNIKHDSSDAMLIEFTSRTGSTQSRYLMMLVADNHSGYVITAASSPDSFERHRKLFSDSLQSFRLPAADH